MDHADSGSVSQTLVTTRRQLHGIAECLLAGPQYQATGEICGHQLPSGLKQCDKLPEPIFTPATKAAAGHDENISEARFAEIIGEDAANYLRTTSLAIYKHASDYAATRGIIIADTKFEFGVDKNGEILLIDEVLTPDSSRFGTCRSTSQPPYRQSRPRPKDARSCRSVRRSRRLPRCPPSCLRPHRRRD